MSEKNEGKKQYSLVFHPDFFNDIKKFDKREKDEIKKQIEKIKENPLRLKHLHGKGNCHTARLGTLRIIYSIENNTIFFLIVERRKEVYDNYFKRLYTIQKKLE